MEHQSLLTILWFLHILTKIGHLVNAIMFFINFSKSLLSYFVLNSYEFMAKGILIEGVLRRSGMKGLECRSRWDRGFNLLE